MRTTLIAIAFLALGIIIGWKVEHIVADGRDGIQWQFNDAASRGDIAKMKRLIEAGADPRAEPSYADGAVSGFTPLFEAASAAEPAAVEFLISNGAEINLVEATETPLDMARYRRAQADKAIEILVGAGAKGLNEMQNPKTEQDARGNRR